MFQKTLAYFGLSVFVLSAFLVVAMTIKANAAQTYYATDSRAAYAPFEEVLQVTPSDVTTYDPPLRGCIVEVGGDLAIDPVKNAASVTITVVAGQTIPIMADRILSTGTTATVVCGR